MLKVLRKVLILSSWAVVAAPTALRGQTRLDDITPFLMEQESEIALARSSAPHDIGAAAAVWVLERDGYRKVSEGTNGFECFVGRGWSGPIEVGPDGNRRLHPDLFDPELRAPHCFNERAATSVLPLHIARTRALLNGMPAERLNVEMAAMLGSSLRRAEPGAMAYMMSPGQDLGPDFAAWRPHVMVYLPDVSNADWGIPGFTHDYPFVAESGSPWAVAVMPMRRYSDGSWAPENVAGRHH